MPSSPRWGNEFCPFLALALQSGWDVENAAAACDAEESFDGESRRHGDMWQLYTLRRVMKAKDLKDVYFRKCRQVRY